MSDFVNVSQEYHGFMTQHIFDGFNIREVPLWSLHSSDQQGLTASAVSSHTLLVGNSLKQQSCLE